MKLNSAYREIARDCLVNWHGMSTEEASIICEDEAIDDLENGVGNRTGVKAMGYIDNVLAYIVARLAMSPDHATKFREVIINGPDSAGVLKQVKEEALAISDEERFEITVLAVIHNNWVKNSNDKDSINSAKANHQLRQYAPLELIGFNEVKSDLIFLEPILNRMGKKINIKKLEKEYNNMGKEFCLDHGLRTIEDLEKYIKSGSYYQSVEMDDSKVKYLTKDYKLITKQIIDNLKANNSSIKFDK